MIEQARQQRGYMSAGKWSSQAGAQQPHSKRPGTLLISQRPVCFWKLDAPESKQAELQPLHETVPRAWLCVLSQLQHSTQPREPPHLPQRCPDDHKQNQPNLVCAAATCGSKLRLTLLITHRWNSSVLRCLHHEAMSANIRRCTSCASILYHLYAEPALYPHTAGHCNHP